ncbi:hypothetical protein BDZ94DRAFT_1301982 [Collybia nuda]|uniref:Uncharacterized protein n=1 Tax=Collybia nuda TaxID=64659 RepID=A0A9P6CCP3_9AGAR|nr:hypothetical protein BDZ94DRAFT_1301982 [Collybia nuda]
MGEKHGRKERDMRNPGRLIEIDRVKFKKPKSSNEKPSLAKPLDLSLTCTSAPAVPLPPPKRHKPRDSKGDKQGPNPRAHVPTSLARASEGSGHTPPAARGRGKRTPPPPSWNTSLPAHATQVIRWRACGEGGCGGVGKAGPGGCINRMHMPFQEVWGNKNLGHPPTRMPGRQESKPRGESQDESHEKKRAPSI